MKRMVLGFLIFNLISFSPVFAGKVAPDQSVKQDAETEGVANIKKINETINASNDLDIEIQTNVDKTETFGDATETNTEK